MSQDEMRAVLMLGKGAPDVLQAATVPRPVPGPGQIQVRVASSGVNRADLLQRRGRYPVPPGYPENIPGMEYAGTVSAVGPHVSDWAVGDRVMGLIGGGGYAQYVVVHQREAIPVPDGLELVEAGAVPEVYLTAFDAMFSQMGLRAGESILIHAVGGGVGTAAVQLARWAGAESFGTSRTLEKLKDARELGLDHGIQGGEDGWSDVVLDLTDGRGVDVVLDLVGGPYLRENIRALAPRGRIITVGVSGGAKTEINLLGLMAKRGSLTGTLLRSRPLEEKAALAREFARVALPALASGMLKPVVDRVYAPEEAPEAHTRMESNENFGKLLIQW